MTLIILSAIVAGFTIVVYLVKEIARQLGMLAVDLANRAKEATPGTITTLKERAGVASVVGSNIATKGVSDLRKVIKLPERKTEPETKAS